MIFGPRGPSPKTFCRWTCHSCELITHQIWLNLKKSQIFDPHHLYPQVTSLGHHLLAPLKGQGAEQKKSSVAHPIHVSNSYTKFGQMLDGRRRLQYRFLKKLVDKNNHLLIYSSDIQVSYKLHLWHGLVKINEQHRSKERRQSHDTSEHILKDQYFESQSCIFFLSTQGICKYPIQKNPHSLIFCYHFLESHSFYMLLVFVLEQAGLILTWLAGCKHWKQAPRL